MPLVGRTQTPGRLGFAQKLPERLSDGASDEDVSSSGESEASVTPAIDYEYDEELVELGSSHTPIRFYM
jgi:hypothetical protein